MTTQPQLKLNIPLGIYPRSARVNRGLPLHQVEDATDKLTSASNSSMLKNHRTRTFADSSRPSGLRIPVGQAPSKNDMSRASKIVVQQELISTKEAAAIFSVTERTIRRWLASGKMPQRVKAGREKKFRRAELETEIKLDAFELITLAQASEILKCSVRTLRRWIASGKMPERIKRGRELKFRYADILWLKETGGLGR